MTVLQITIDDADADYIKKVLNEFSAIKSVEEVVDENSVQQSESVVERIKKIQQRIGNQELFKEITDPSEWQREIRKEWDRDF